MATIDIKRAAAVNLTLNIDTSTVLVKRLIGQDYIKAVFKSNTVLDIALKDYIEYGGVQYNVNTPPGVIKRGSNSYTYTVTFESEYYDLGKAMFLDADGNSEFYLTGDVDAFIDLIATNMNRDGSGWSRGTTDQSDTEYKNLKFSGESCFQVLNRLATEFHGEYDFTAKAINFTDQIGSASGKTLQYKSGLKTITRDAPDKSNVITRLYGWGSERNIGPTYRAVGDRSRRLKFEDGVTGSNYEENNIGTYGVIEGEERYDDIYPHRNGTISWVNGGDVTVFRDSGMDFDVNSYLLPGVIAEIHFQSGDLAGYSFKLSSYGNGDKEFTIIAEEDDQGYVLPNATLKPAVNDKYTILNISMPASYIDAAETELENRISALLAIVSIPKVTYKVTNDHKYFKENSLSFGIGDTVTIQDTPLSINVTARITSFTQQLINPYKYTIELSNNVSTPVIRRVVASQAAQGFALLKQEDQLKSDKLLITGDRIESLAIEAGHIDDLSITTSKLDNLAVTTAKINALAVTAAQIANLTIIGGKIANTTITATQIASLTITSTQIANATITGAKLVNSTVTGGKIANSTITGGKLANTTITAGKIANLTITAAQIANLTITGGAAGKIAGSTITEDNIVANTITAASIAAGTITTNEIAAGTIVAGDIAAGTITADRINVANLSSIAVDAGSIMSGTITGALIRTSSGGQRVEMDNSTNTLKFYTGGKLVMYLDDNVGNLGSPGIIGAGGTIYLLATGGTEKAFIPLYIKASGNYGIGNYGPTQYGALIEFGNEPSPSGNCSLLFGALIHIDQSTTATGIACYGLGIYNTWKSNDEAYGLYVFADNSGTGAAYGIYIPAKTNMTSPIYSLATQASLLSGDLALASGKKLVLDGSGGNDYLIYTSSEIQAFIGGASILQIGASDVYSAQDFAVASGKKVLFDGVGGNDYFILSGGSLLWYLAGSNIFKIGSYGMYYAGTEFGIGNSAGGCAVAIKAGNNSNAFLLLTGDNGDDNGDKWKMSTSSVGSSELVWSNDTSGSLVEKMRLYSDGLVKFTGLAGTGTRTVKADANGKLSAP